ncbi:acetylglutamate kinase [Bryobacter aggregatus]|uniref:acetylglutamate kinase n=1 Tax=Bryobacter aggregatus TaxID=360054 RepID=UPI0004E0E8C7|nr:acetylglutamate kinase [Bryobacter aggregatus]
MKLLVKLGGTLLDNPDSRTSLSQQLAALYKTNPILTIVHGGGKQMTRFLEAQGVQSIFVEGLRVSSPEVMDAVLKVFAGSVNHGLVSTLVAQGLDAVGLTGIDCALTECEIVNPALGQVGKPVRANTRILDTLTGDRFLPVIACVGGDKQGGIYNVNADQMATSLAAAWKVDRLLFLTDVEGVRGADGQRIPVLHQNEANALIESGVATGGMLAKLRAAEFALQNGVGEVRIVDGATPNVLERVQGGEALGTAFLL